MRVPSLVHLRVNDRERLLLMSGADRTVSRSKYESTSTPRTVRPVIRCYPSAE